MRAPAAIKKSVVSSLKSLGGVLSTSKTPQAAPSMKIGTLLRETMPWSAKNSERVNSDWAANSRIVTDSPVRYARPGTELKSAPRVAVLTTPSFQPIPAATRKSACFGRYWRTFT